MEDTYDNYVVDYPPLDVFLKEYKEDVIEYLIENYSSFKNKVGNFNDFVIEITNKIDNIIYDEDIVLTYKTIKDSFIVYKVLSVEDDITIEQRNKIYIKEFTENLNKYLKINL